MGTLKFGRLLKKSRLYFQSALTWVLTLLPCIVACAISFSDQGRFDLLLSDPALRLNYRPASEKIVIVGIDQPSLASLGRWPWPRRIHAQLIERIAQSQPAAIGLDVLLSEPDALQPENDVQLENAFRRAGNVVVPASMYVDAQGQPHVVEPLQRFTSVAAATAHANYEPDFDGIVRSVFLEEGTGSRRWDHFAVALLRVSGFPMGLSELPGARAPASTAQSPSDNVWLRDYWSQIVFAGPPGHFKTYSYIDVLEGRVPEEALRGKIVMVGATATGMGDAPRTPVGTDGANMPGVELLANVLDGLLQGKRLDLAQPWENTLFCLAPVLLAMIGLRKLSPRNSLLLVMALIVLVPLLAGLAQPLWGVRYAVSGAEIGLLLAYPLWSWRRQELALTYFRREFERIRQEHPELNFSSTGSSVFRGPSLERHISFLQTAADQLRAVHIFLQSSLNALPDAVLATDPAGLILLANPSAAAHFHQPDANALRGLNIDTIVEAHLKPVARVIPRLGAAKDAFAFTLETAADSGCDLLVKGVPRRGPQGEFAGWIVTLVDITSVRELLKARNEALNFISHDIRGPQAAILTFIELQRVKIGAGTQDDVEVMLQRIERLARQSLALAENFMQLARAESGAYVLQEADLSDIVMEAVDQMWVQANQFGMRINTSLPESPALSAVERSLIGRAIVNILGNAIKFSARNTNIDCTLRREGPWWCIAIRDQGIGVLPQDIPLLFQKFRRLNSTRRAHPDGAGLGLTFVKAVITQHKGQIEVLSAPGVGTEFRLKLPALGE